MAYGTSFAQNLFKISGLVQEDKALNIPSAIISLIHAKDSIVVQRTSSDMDGYYAFTQVKTGIYLIQVTAVGYVTHYSDPLNINADVIKYNLKIVPAVKEINMVNISAKKPFIEHQIDKTVINVENSIVSTGNSALELLEKAPGVTVDKQNEVIKKNNKSGVVIMIDGKTSFLSAAELTNLLGNMSSDQISTIELITNPSSKYDAAGN